MTNLPAIRGDDQKEILEILGLPEKHIHSKALLLLADRYGLDPLLKEIVVIPGRGPFVGVKGAVSVALRSGLLDGIEADDYEETDTHYIVRCTVWRKDMRHPAAKVKGRVARNEKKEWPFEVARARAIRAALSYAFNIHDDYGDDDWTPPPDDNQIATIVNGKENTGPTTTPRADPATGEIAGPPPANTENPGEAAREAQDGGPAAAPPDTEPPTILVGGHTLAQRLAIAARKAGIEEDEDRHAIIRAATKGKWTRGTDIPENADPDTIDRIFAAFAGLTNGTIELRYEPDDQPTLWRVRRQ